MKISIRLLLLLVFLALVLPYLLPNLGYRSAQKIDEEQQRVERDYNTRVEATHGKFTDELDSLGLVDDALRACIMSALDLYAKMSDSDGSISSAFDLQNLRCEDRNITDLDGLSHFTKLQRVSFANNDIRSLLALSQHPSINSIDLRGNANLEWLDSLSTLQELRRVRFPGLTPKQCEIAKDVVDVMRSRHGAGVSSNIEFACR